MVCKAPLSTLASAIFFAYAQASYLQSDLSFGHTNDKISPDPNFVPGWHRIGKPNPPEILSNKVVLTPPAPGNERGALWSEKVLEHASWATDIDFRATGPERGGGNLQLWYARNGESEVGTSSIYTVGKFDGLVLSIDQYAGSGGFVRGFLNDGSTDYKSHHSVDSLAFGHCEYAYRNLGRPSRITIRQSVEGLKVTIDGNTCFESTKIKLPTGYNLGVTAASAENPDSFEMFKFVTTTETHAPESYHGENMAQIPETNNIPEAQQAQQPQGQNAPQNQNNPLGDIPAYSSHLNTPPEEPASRYQSSGEQFADLHNRLQSMMKAINALSRDENSHAQQISSKYEDLNHRLARLEQSMDKINAMDGKLNSLADKMEKVLKDVRQTKGDLNLHFAGLKNDVKDTHSVVHGAVEGARGMGTLGFVGTVLGSQGLLVGAYLLYKRRKANGPKKYL